jgi:hypothetical protein
MNKIRSTTITSIIGKKAKRLKGLRESYSQFGALAMKKRKSTSLQLFGTQDTRIYSPYLLAATISQSKKQDKF